MEKNFNYSILKYRHSAVLGESLNIAVLVFFQHDGQFDFIYSKRLSRIRTIYPSFSERTIKSYLRFIKGKVDRLQSISDEFTKLEIQENFDQFISAHLLPQDESSLQFSRSKEGIQFNRSNNKVVEHLSKTYLLDDEETKTNKDHLLVQRFYNNIKENLGENLSPDKFRKNYKIKNKTGVEFTFNYAWQNGSFNLVKPLNFDLKEPRFISEKAYKNYGLVVDLEEQAQKRNLHFDYLVGRPQDKRLFREYDHSIKLLSSLPSIKIVEEEDIHEYSISAITALRKEYE